MCPKKHGGHMDKKPSDELIGSQIHVLLFIIISVVTLFKCDYAFFKLQYTVVGKWSICTFSVILSRVSHTLPL